MRRSSYAAALAGNTGSSSANTAPTRSGAFSHLINAGSAPHTIGQHRHSRSIDADGHHNSMSTSWGRGGALPSYSSQTGHWQGLGGGAQDIPPFFVPSYLRGSKHAEKLQEAHKAKLAAQREFRSQHSSNAGSLSTSSSSANLRKAASHYPMTHEVIERAPVFVDEPVSPWPTRWNDSDKFAQLDIEDGGRQAKFTGTTQKTHDEAASVRADCAMPRQCGIYYYEVTVVSKGKDGYGSLRFERDMR